METLETALKKRTWNKLDNKNGKKLKENKENLKKLKENKESLSLEDVKEKEILKQIISVPPEVHVRIPICIGWDEDVPVNELEKREREAVKSFKAQILGIMARNDCDVFLASSAPQPQDIDKLIRNTYFFVEERLFYVDKWTKNITKVKVFADQLKELKEGLGIQGAFLKKNEVFKCLIEKLANNQFETITALTGHNPRNYDYTIYLSLKPENIKALSDWLHANAEILNLIPKKKIVLISEWRKELPYKLAYDRYHEFLRFIEAVSKIDLKQMTDQSANLLEKANDMFAEELCKLNEKFATTRDDTLEERIVAVADSIFRELNEMFNIDLEKTKQRRAFKGMTDEEIINHIRSETADWISWKQLLNEDGTEPVNSEINVVMYPFPLFKSMEIIDKYSTKLGYTKNTPVHLIPETEDLIIEDKKVNQEVRNDEFDNQPLDVNNLLVDITTRLELIAPKKGVQFFYEFINMSKKENNSLNKNPGLLSDVPNNSTSYTNRGRTLSPHNTHAFTNGEMKSKTSSPRSISPNKAISTSPKSKLNEFTQKPENGYDKNRLFHSADKKEEINEQPSSIPALNLV